MGSGERPATARYWQAAVDMVHTALAHDLPKLAAALTYYAVLSLFPALIVIVALLGVVGLSEETLQTFFDEVGELGAPWAVDMISDVLDGILSSPGAEVALGVSTLFSLWAASAYVGAFMWASDSIYMGDERRPYWRRLPLRVALALLVIGLLCLAVIVVVFAGPVGDWVAGATGIGAGPLKVWSWIKWPLLLVFGLFTFGLLYRFAPARSQPSLWRLLAGAGVAVALWLVASVGFSIFLTYFASYDRVYGTLASGVAFLVWTWVTNIVVLVGVEVNREIEQRRGA